MLIRRAAVATALALAAASAPAAAQQAGVSGSFDPAASGAIVAVAVADANGPAVVVRPGSGPPVRFADARSPAVDGERLAYADSGGIRVVGWRSGLEITRLDGDLSKPALDWPRLAYVRPTRGGGQSLELVHLVTGTRRVVARVGSGVDLGRPALRRGLIAWHVAAGRHSEIRITSAVRLGRGRVVAASVTGLQINPSLSGRNILWVEQAASTSYLRLRAIAGGRVRTLATLQGSRHILWTSALGGRTAYATRWNPTRARGTVIARRWR